MRLRRGRAIDAVSRTTSSGTAVSYPLFDTNGNNIGLLAKSGSSWTIGSEKSYTAWGELRTGSADDNKARFGATSNHKTDDESGLVYMRARYYEPSSGRFISQDSKCDGANWYVYCKNNPVNYIDESGNCPLLFILFALLGGLIGGIMRCILKGEWSWKQFGIGFLEGAICTAGCFLGPWVGAAVSSAVNMIDCWLSGGDGKHIAMAGIIGAFTGGIGGIAGPLMAIAERQLLLYFLVAVDMGIMSADGEAYGTMDLR